MAGWRKRKTIATAGFFMVAADYPPKDSIRTVDTGPQSK
jgi:hypothetical protein